MSIRPFATANAVVGAIHEKLSKPGSLAATLLGIGPMSEAVLRAAIELGRDEDFPVMFIASRNQVDSEEFGGGYVRGWTTEDFCNAILKIVRETDFTGLLYVCRDHGGPWQRDEEKAAGLAVGEAMRRGRASFVSDLLAGLTLLHVDPTKDPHCKGAVPLNVVIERTVELIESIEAERRARRLSPVSFEIGTEETTGGLTGAEAFEEFIVKLTGELADRALPRPAFIVGQTGTLMRMTQQVGHFKAEHARALAAIARKHGMGLKEHNADYLDDETLRLHPELGITSANVAPEFGFAETRALLELAGEERAAARGGEHSNFELILSREALGSGRWKKWLIEDPSLWTEEIVRATPAKLRAIAELAGHYVFDNEPVAAARKKLCDNARSFGVEADPDRRILNAVKESIRRYADAFRMPGLTSKLKEALGLF